MKERSEIRESYEYKQYDIEAVKDKTMFGSATVYEDMTTLNDENGLNEILPEEKDMKELIRKLKELGLKKAGDNLQSD